MVFYSSRDILQRTLSRCAAPRIGANGMTNLQDCAKARKITMLSDSHHVPSPANRRQACARAAARLVVADWRALQPPRLLRSRRRPEAYKKGPRFVNPTTIRHPLAAAWSPSQPRRTTRPDPSTLCARPAAPFNSRER